MQKVEQALDKIRPEIRREGGEVKLVDVDRDKGLVKIDITGISGACPRNRVKIERDIEKFLREEVPWVVFVEEA
jgi:Fe-S cluster biogenesis protein NfuA